MNDARPLLSLLLTVYIIAWGKRETMEHRGNLTEYFAKLTLTVKSLANLAPLKGHKEEACRLKCSN